MKKRIVALSAALMLFAGVVNASSINGDYKGNPIVKVKVNGSLLNSDVPAINYDGSTLIPLRSAAEALGATVEWDPTSQTASLKTSGQIDSPVNSSYTSVLNEYQSFVNDAKNELGNNVKKLSFNIEPNGVFLYIAYAPPSSLELNQITTNIVAMGSLTSLLANKVSGTRIELVSGPGNSADIVITIDGGMSEKYAENKISKDDYVNSWTIQNNMTTPAGTTNNTKPTSPSVSKKTVPVLYSNDGKTYLGKLTSDEYDSDSIYNDYGKYGGQYANLSIFNDYGTYGGEYSDESPFNKYASKPPIIILDGKVLGHLTVNTTIKDAISPVGLKEWLKKKGY